MAKITHWSEPWIDRSLTDEGGCDGMIAPTLIRQTGHIDSIVADKGYDQIGVYEYALAHLNKNGKIMIHPRANGVISASGEAALRQRNQHLKSISEDGVLAWRRASGYYRQSEVENMFYRYKTLLGDQLRARGENSRQVESVLACNILNQFRLLGRPEGELVT